MRELLNFIPVTDSDRTGRKYLLHLVVSLWVVMSLVACSSLPDLPVTDESYAIWAEHQRQLSKLNSWQIHARAVISVEAEVYQVGINWQREIDRFVIVIEAPFGQGVFRVESNPQANGQPPTMLSLPDGQVFFDDSVESLLIRVFGWPIPVSGLKWWIKGLPLPDTDYSFDLLGDGRLKTLRQDKWLINYLDYFAPDTATSSLPRKIYLKHEDLALKIVIERWQQFEAETKSPTLFPDFN
jgi:outer membrane lipoprotein LolB